MDAATSNPSRGLGLILEHCTRLAAPLGGSELAGAMAGHGLLEGRLSRWICDGGHAGTGTRIGREGPLGRS